MQLKKLMYLPSFFLYIFFFLFYSLFCPWIKDARCTSSAISIMRLDFFSHLSLLPYFLTLRINNFLARPFIHIVVYNILFTAPYLNVWNKDSLKKKKKHAKKTGLSFAFIWDTNFFFFLIQDCSVALRNTEKFLDARKKIKNFYL